MNIDQYLGGTITILHANNIISEMRFITLTLKCLANYMIGATTFMSVDGFKRFALKHYGNDCFYV